MKIVIADDEPELAHYLQRLLLELDQDIQICGLAENGLQALEIIRQESPDVAFLDIRMPGLSGLEVSSRVSDRCKIVFVTAYDEHAIQAFEENAVDYLLKPFTKDRLRKTVNRLQGSPRFSTSDLSVLKKLFESIMPESETDLNWIKASVGPDIYMIHVDDVIYFCADTKYTNVVMKDRTYPIRLSLNELETRLESSKFWRVHRNAIVCVRRIKTAKRLIDGRYVLKLEGHDTEITVSRTYAHRFKQS